MYIIGITGGVGSGKTEAAHILAKIADAKLLIADELGHVAMEKHSKGYDAILAEFGDIILDEDQNICRQTLSKLVFQNKEKLKKLNEIIHPIVLDYIQNYIHSKREEEGYLILENAIMFETGCDVYCDEIWYISVSSEIRKERLLKNRGYSIEKSESIMQQQLQDAAYQKRCQRVVPNNNSIEALKKELQTAFDAVSICAN